MEDQYLIIEPDGTRTSMYVTDRAGVEQMLATESEYAEMAGRNPVFLDSIPMDAGGAVAPGTWHEGKVLILKVKVVVPTPVTTKWALP